MSEGVNEWMSDLMSEGINGKTHIYFNKWMYGRTSKRQKVRYVHLPYTEKFRFNHNSYGELQENNWKPT